MNLSTLILFIVFLINFGLLIFILVNSKKGCCKPIFTMVGLLAAWQLTEILNIVVFADSPYLIWSVRAGLMPALYLAPAFVWLVYELFGKWPQFDWWKKTLWFLPAIVMTPFVFTSYNLDNVMIQNGRVFYQGGPLYWYFAAYFVALMVYALMILFKNHKKTKVIVKRQINYIFVASILTALAGLFFNIILPIWGWGELYYSGINSTIFFSTLVTYALFRYRFFSLKLSFYRVMTDLVRLLITGFIFYLFYFILAEFVRIDFSIVRNIFWLVVFIGFSAPLVFRLVNKLVDALLFNPMQDIEEAEEKIADILRSSRDLNILFVRFSKEIGKIIDFKEIFVYLSKKDNPDAFYQVFPVGERLLNKKDSQLLSYLAGSRQMANAAEIDYLNQEKSLSKEMKDKQVDIALPIFYNKQLLGVLLLDVDRSLLSLEELEFLKNINRYLDIAIGSLLLYQQDMAEK